MRAADSFGGLNKTIGHVVVELSPSHGWVMYGAWN